MPEEGLGFIKGESHADTREGSRRFAGGYAVALAFTWVQAYPALLQLCAMLLHLVWNV